MNNFTKLLLFLCSFSVSNAVSAQVSGSVFRDFNGNGVKNNSATFNEPFVQGVTVKATLANGTSFITTTSAAGTYSFTAVQIPAASVVRVEFSGLATGDYSSFNGTGNGTNVRFVTSPNAATGFAINAPDDFWNNTTSPNPTFLVIAERKGLTVGGYQATAGTVIQSNTLLTGPYNPADNTIAATGTMTNVATQQQTGSLFGLAVQNKQQRYFAAAYLRRAIEIGPRGPGGIYLFDKSGVNFSLTGSFTLQGVVPSNGGGALDFGTVTRVTTPATDDNFIANTGNFPGETRDIDAFAKAGTISYGDIEADANSDKVFMINLFQKRLIVFNGTAATATLNGAGAAALAPFTTAYDILSLPGIPAATGAGNNIRPYAIKIYKGKGYLGVVSDAMATQNGADLRGYILQFDPNNIAAGFTTVLTINFNTWPTAAARYWRPWAITWAQTGGDGTASNPRDYPTPIIAGIEFNEDGSMDIGIKDRWGDQGGTFEFNAVSGATGHTQCSINGDLLHACWTGTAWALEGTPGSCTQPAGNTNGFTANNSFGGGFSYGNTGLEWYADRSGDGGYEVNIGGMTKLMGSGTILSTVYDPMGMGENSSAVDGLGNGVYWSTQGIQYNNVTTGAKSQIARVLTGSTNSVDKSNGMGDIEFLAELQPVQIGNRIWLDANSDGIQDANETTAGVAAGTTVTLRSPGVDGIYGNVDDQTWTTTTDAAGNYYFSALSAADNRKPATWTGVGNTILPGFDYRIELAVPSNLQLTIANTAANSLDNIDNDGIVSGTNAIVTFNTSNTNHNFDFGFKSLASIGDKVWLDNGTGSNAGNGVQDAGEPGVAGLTVTLKDNAGAVVAATVSDSYGNYLFDNLTPGNYTVTVTPPANYIFTAQTNTVDNTAGTAPITTGSDVNATTGQSYVINLVAGENERNIDAGLVFSQPTTVSLGDKVWFDNGAGGGTASNGVQDGAEPGVAGVMVTLYASNGTTVLATTVTDANGNYRFNNLTAGVQYIVGFTPPAGFIFTGKDLGGNDNADSDVNTAAGATFGKTDLLAALTAGENRTSVDAGLVQQPATAASVGDKVWNDLNQNGIQDAGEPGVAGVTVTLYQNGTAIATTVTDAFGNYIFNNLTAGTGYQVGITMPADYTLSPSNAAGVDNKLDNDIETALGNRTAVFPLTAGLRNLTLDAGIYQTAPAGTAKLGDKVWFDANGNGTQDGGNETGVSGVTVELLNSGGTSIDPDGAGPLTRTLTVIDANGNYQFVNLAAGNYIVAFSNIPSGYSFTQQVTPGDNGNNTNSDANPLTGRSSVIALTAGESDQTIDAGLVAGTSSGLGSLGNKIWYDLPVTAGGTDGNGIQDAGESGVAGVTVTLLDAGADGILGNGDDGSSRTTITNALGEYLFTGLPEGNYVVQYGTAALPLPAGFTATTQNTGANDNKDSDGGAIAAGGAPAGSSRTGVISLTAGQDNLSVDFGLRPAGNTNTLGDKVWADNGAGGGIANDGVQNGTEPGIAGVTVTLYNNAGTAIATTTTDANGQYLFAGLANGTYSVGFSNLPAGFDLTTPDTDGVPGNGTLDSDANRVSGRTGTVTLGAANRNDRTLDAGIVSTRAALGNFVWYDTNGDGDQDAGEAGVPGVTVSLYFDANNDGDFLDAGENLPASSIITDQNGAYFFPNLLPGNYRVGFTTIPAGVNFTTQDAGGNDALDSDVIISTGKTATVNLSPGEVDLTVDAGLFRPQATVGNFIWVDNGAGGGTSGNGVQDGTEPGLPGVIVTLFDANTNLPIATTVTDGSGGYIFNNAAPGTYYLQIGNLPSGAAISPQDAGGNDNTDNDFNPGTSRTANFVVPPTAVNLSFDGGVLTDLSALPVTITDFTAIKNNNTAELNWKVEAETNVGSYIVERSADGRNFASIASVNATGSSSYRAADAQPLKGSNYYRLRVIDLDGSIQYSEVRIVVFGSKGIINVFPNPAADRINVLLPESWQGKAVSIDIMDQTGRVVIKLSRKQSGQVETVDISKLPAAAYLLRLINSDGEQEVRKIQVTK